MTSRDSGMMREASRLDALVPLPIGFVNQRYAAFFAKYPVSGKTHPTGNAR